MIWIFLLIIQFIFLCYVIRLNINYNKAHNEIIEVIEKLKDKKDDILSEIFIENPQAYVEREGLDKEFSKEEKIIPIKNRFEILDL